MADYTLTVYADDDTTPLFVVGTSAAHANPYLKTPTEFGEAEVDLQEGRALIGQINLEVIDKQTGATQPERFLTALLGNAAGYSALNRRRALFQQTAPTVVVIMDGVVGGVTLLESFAGFRLPVRDIRERGRKLRCFTHATSSTVFPRGVWDGYGLLPTGEWLVPPTVPLTGTYTAVDAVSGTIALTGAPTADGQEVAARLVVTDTMRRAVQPGFLPSFPGYGPVYDRVSVSWRPTAGGAWVELVNMNAFFHNLGAELLGTRAAKVRTADGQLVDVRAAISLSLTDTATGSLPTNGQAVDVILRYRGEPSEDYPFHYEGTRGTFLRNLLRGDYCSVDEAGAQIDPRLRYDEPALLADVTPIRIRLTEPRKDLRVVLEEVCKAGGMAPALDVDGEISPIRYALPDATVPLPEINNGNAKPIAGWEHPTSNAVTQVEVTYPRDYLVPAEIDPNGERAAGDGIASREVQIIRRAPQAVLDVMGEQPLEIDAWMFRALGGREGQPLSGDVLDETGAQLAREREHQAIDRFAYGGQVSFCRVMRSAFPTLRCGDWVLDARSWRPNYLTSQRGGNALAQVVSVAVLNDAWLAVRLIDSGPADSPVGQPTLGTVTVDAAGVVSVPVTVVPTGGEARVDYAISPTLPATTSGLWTFLGRTATVATLVSPPLPAGEIVWVRARGEQIGRRPSAWTTPVSVTVPSTPRVNWMTLELDADGVVTVAAEFNALTAGVRVFYALHAPDVAPSFSSIDRAVGAFPLVLPGLFVPPGMAVTVELEPWTGWTGATVSGTAGAILSATTIKGPGVTVEPWSAAAYGIVGDDSTDNTAAFVAAIDGVVAAGLNYLYLPPGIYQASQIRRKTDVTIEGSGHGTILKQKANSTDGAGGPLHFIVLDDVDVEHSTLRNLVVDGNKSAQTEENHGIYFDQTGGDWETNDQHHLDENLQVRNCKGSGFMRGTAARETRCVNVHAWQNDGYGIGIPDGGGTDNWIINCTAEANGLSGFRAGGYGDRHIGCKAFGNGALLVSGDQAGFLVDGLDQSLVACEAQENRGQGFQFKGPNCRAVVGLGLIASSNDAEGYLFDGVVYCHVQGISANFTGHAYVQSWDFRIESGNFNILEITVGGGDVPSSSGVFDGVNTESNQIRINSRWIGRLYDSWGDIGDDNEHFSWGKVGATAVGNPYYTLKTNTASPPHSRAESWDGTTSRTYFVFNHGTGRLVLGTSGGVQVDLDNHLTPTANGSFDLGSPSLKFRNVYAASFLPSGDITPGSDNAYDLGSASFRWNDVYGVNFKPGGHIVPTSSAAYDLGEFSGNRFRNFYGGSVDLTGGLAADGVIVSSYGTVGSSADEHVRFGKTGNPAASNPYFVFVTSAAAAVYGALQSWDGTTNRIYLRMQHSTGWLSLGEVGNVPVRISGDVGFYDADPVAKPTGVAVTAAGIHAALVTLGLIGA